MQGYHGAELRDEQAPYEPPPEPASATTHAREFQRGDIVTLNDRDGRNITGPIVRINRRTATLGTGTGTGDGDGGTWRDAFHALRVMSSTSVNRRPRQPVAVKRALRPRLPFSAAGR